MYRVLQQTCCQALDKRRDKVNYTSTNEDSSSLCNVEPLKDHVEELMKEDGIVGPLTEEEEGTWISYQVITDKKWGQEAKGQG